MEEFEIEESKGLCLVCAGHSDGVCFCGTLILDPNSHHHEVISNEEGKKEEETKPTHQHYDRKKKDNVAHKRFSTVLKNIFKRQTGKAINSEIQKNYYRKDYFVMVLCFLEKAGALKEAYEQFEFELSMMIRNIKIELKEKPEELEYLIELARDHKEAFTLFIQESAKQCGGFSVEEVLSVLFHPEDMRQKKNYKKSLEMIKNMRKDMGLSF